jgi:hypothetical protein
MSANSNSVQFSEFNFSGVNRSIERLEIESLLVPTRDEAFTLPQHEL